MKDNTMKDNKKLIFLILSIIYIISPIDFVPGPIDDVILAICTIVANTRNTGRSPKALPIDERL